MLSTFRVARVRKKGPGGKRQEATEKQRREEVPEMVQVLDHRGSHTRLCYTGTIKAGVYKKSCGMLTSAAHILKLEQYRD